MTKKKEKKEFDFSVLRELRNLHKVTLEKLAEETGVSFSTLARIESNQNQPSLNTLKRLAEYFGLSPAHLLDLSSTFIIEHGKEERDLMDPVKRRFLNFSNIGLRINTGKAGDPPTQPHQHLDSYQVTWILEGHMVIDIHGEEHQLKAGEAIKFDAAFEHKMHFLADTRYVVAIVPKHGK